MGSAYGECTFSARSALVKVWRTTSDHRVLNVHSSNKSHESILQSTKTLNATNNENYGKCKQQLADARTIRKILLARGHLPQDAPNSRLAFFHEAFLGLRYYRTTLQANDKQQSCADKLQRKAGRQCLRLSAIRIVYSFSHAHFFAAFSHFLRFLSYLYRRKRQ